MHRDGVILLHSAGHVTVKFIFVEPVVELVNYQDERAMEFLVSGVIDRNPINLIIVELHQNVNTIF